MKVRDALLIEGSSKCAILCYGIFPATELDRAFETMKAEDGKIHKFLGVRWPSGLILNETYIEQERDFTQVISNLMAGMFEVGPCLAALCMYDGAFGSFEDIFAPHAASQTYAFCFSQYEPAIILDTSLLESQEWNSIIAGCRQRFLSLLLCCSSQTPKPPDESA